jgi:hypothetical protein
VAVEQGGNLSLSRLRKQRSRAVAQNFGQRIGECPWLGELENITIGHGWFIRKKLKLNPKSPPRPAAGIPATSA